MASLLFVHPAVPLHLLLTTAEELNLVLIFPASPAARCGHVTRSDQWDERKVHWGLLGKSSFPIKRERGRGEVPMPNPFYLWRRLCEGIIPGSVAAICDLKVTSQRKKSQPNEEGREGRWRQPESLVTLLNF